jgi:hypothetical protein
VITLLEILIPALTLSALAGVCLASLPNAPPRIRFCIALVGLAAWVVPWPWVRLPLDFPDPFEIGGDVESALARVIFLTGQIANDGRQASQQFEYWGHAAVLLFPGVLWFVADCFALHRSARSWRRMSRCGEALRSLLPADLRDVRAEIRIVRGARVAAASGWIRPTIWVGDRLTIEELKLALVHESCHILRRDPIWLTLILAIRRAYWWNPMVAYLARQAVLMMESICDHRSARCVGRRRYIEQLAAMVLAADAATSPRLAAMALRPSLNVMRLKLLKRRMRLRLRDCALIGLLAAAGATVTAAQVFENPHARPRWSHVAIPATPAGSALTTLLGAFNDGDLELMRTYLGAYTPQEVKFPVFDWTSRLELIEVVNSERLRIEYIVKDTESELRRLGTLEVTDSPVIEVRVAELRNL